MPKIKFLPDDIEIEVDEGTSILDAALENGIDVETICGGNCICTACEVVIVEGKDNLSPREDEEANLLEMNQEEVTSRLSCQAKVYGDIIVDVVD